MARVERDLWGSPSPTPLPKQGHLEQVAKRLVQAGFEYLQRRRIHNLSGQPVPVFRHPQSEEVFPHVQMELLVLMLGTTEESGPILLTPALKRFVGIYKVPSQPSLLQAKQAQLPQPFLF